MANINVGSSLGLTYLRACSSSVNVPCKSPVFVQKWSEDTQKENGDCLGENYVAELPEKVYMGVEHNDTADLIDIWKRISKAKQEDFIEKYGQIATLALVEVNAHFLKAAVQFWDPSHRCFSFNKNDLTPTIEEYSVLLGANLQYPDKVYNRNPKVTTFSKLFKIIGKQSGDANFSIVHKGMGMHSLGA